jgi:hypothetical protein
LAFYIFWSSGIIAHSNIIIINIIKW